MKYKYIPFMIVLIIYNSAFSSPWPLVNFNQQHRNNGNFGECRKGYKDDILIGRHHMHDGLDIGADSGTSVYPVMSGTVYSFGNESIIIKTIDGELTIYHGYVHIDRNMSLVEGNSVTVSSTVLGTINEKNHLHLRYGLKDQIVADPIINFNLSPYNDSEKPTFATFDAITVVNSLDTSQSEDFYYYDVNTIQEGDRVDILVNVIDSVTIYGGNNNGIKWISALITGPGSYEKSIVGYYFSDFCTGHYPDPRLVFAPGSTTGKNIYNITNFEESNSFWDTSNCLEGSYKIFIEVGDFHNQSGTSNYNCKSRYIYISASPSQDKIGRNQK
ncbi:MAG: M23 family metallopeptidase [bacterium]